MSKGIGCGVHILALQLTSSVILSKFLNFSGSYPLHRASLVAQMVKSLPEMQRLGVRFLGQEDPLEKEMATQSNILAWKIPWMEEPGRLQSKGTQSDTTEQLTFIPYICKREQ